MNGVPEWVGALPTVNALMNATAATFLVVGFRFVRRGRVDAHRACMLAAVAASALFLAGYLTLHAHVGTTRFAHTGWLRTAYLTVLVTHSVLATAVPFLAAITLWRALRGRFDAHARIARWTLPIWLYVSVTGVIVYVMLYRLPAP